MTLLDSFYSQKDVFGNSSPLLRNSNIVFVDSNSPHPCEENPQTDIAGWKLDRKKFLCNRESEHEYGFTIIEVMIAVLLLSMSLVAIFGTQFSAVKSTNYVKNITTATELGRCRMSEIEMAIQEDGFQIDTVNESGDCCEMMIDDLPGDFTCEWEIETIMFPDMTQMMNPAQNGGSLTGSDSDPGMLNGVLGNQMADPMMADMMDQQLGGMDQNDMAGMGMEMMSSFMPTLTALLEQAIRRVTVKVLWKEGSAQKDFELVQYVTHPSSGPLKLLQDAAAMGALSEDLDLDNLTGKKDKKKKSKKHSSGGGKK